MIIAFSEILWPMRKGRAAQLRLSQNLGIAIFLPLFHPMEERGQPASLWGLHSWGYNLCPAKPESQRFMLEYIREMSRPKRK